jgi:hypothetical protein
MITYLVENCWSYFVFVVATALLLWSIHRFCPSIPAFLRSFCSTLLREFRLRPGQLVAEKLNALYVTILGIIVVILVLGFAPSALVSSLGADQSASTVWALVVAVVALLLAGYVSVTWIERYNRQARSLSNAAAALRAAEDPVAASPSGQAPRTEMPS